MRKEIFEKILDFLFPRFCVGCGKEGGFVCEECLNKIREEELRCPYCGKVNFSGEFCGPHKRHSSIKGLIFYTFFDKKDDSKIIPKILYGFKYEGLRGLGEILALYMSKKLQKHFLFKKKDKIIIVPLPLFFFKKLKRGFNQTEILSKYIASRLGLKNKKIIFKVKNTKPQVFLSKEERKINVKNAFVLNPKIEPSEIKDKIIILIDDVYTTGSTLNSAAREIKRLRPSEIWGLVFAKEEKR